MAVTFFFTLSYTCGQNDRGIRPLVSSDEAGNMVGTAVWERVRQVMLNIISVGEKLNSMIWIGVSRVKGNEKWLGSSVTVVRCYCCRRVRWFLDFRECRDKNMFMERNDGALADGGDL